MADSEAEHAPDSVIQQIADAVSLYRGDLLQGVYDDWCLVQREALLARYLFALEYLMRAHMARKAWDKALMAAHKLLGTDPLQEHIHRAVMRCHYLLGNRPAAVKQYAACVQLLRRELDVEPMEETRRIYETIISVTPRSPEVDLERKRAPVRRSPKGHRTPLEEVNLAMANIDTARGWLVDASEQLSSPSGGKPR